jgi:hypothetical protein
MAKLTLEQLEQRIVAIEKHIKTGAPLEALEEVVPAPAPAPAPAPGSFQAASVV